MKFNANRGHTDCLEAVLAAEPTGTRIQGRTEHLGSAEIFEEGDRVVG